MTRALPSAVRRHWLLGLFLLGGVVLRVLAEFAYQPALLYIDSFRYLTDLGLFYPGGIDPVGYEWFLLGPLLEILHTGLGAVVVVQHLLGLALGVAIYALLLRFGARHWVAALSAAPVLLDAYQVQIEHNIMSDLLFEVFLLAAVLLLMWWGRPGPVAAALAGVMLAGSVLVRMVGLTAIVPAVAFVLLAAGLRRWRRQLRVTGALVVGFAAALTCYGFYHLSWTGNFALGGSTGSVVYGRAAVVADCDRLPLNPEERLVCPREPIAQREANGIDFYVNFFRVDANVNALPAGVDYQRAQHTFALKVLTHQPLDVVGGVVADFLKGFAPTRQDHPGDVPLDRWKFSTTYPLYSDPWYVTEWTEVYGDGTYSVNPGLASLLRSYQSTVGYAPGIVLGAALLLGAGAALGVGRARRSGLRAVCLLPTGMALALTATAAVMEFSWRYQLPVLVLAPLAGGLGLTAVTGRLRPADAGGTNITDMRDHADPAGPAVRRTGQPAADESKENDMAGRSPLAAFPDEVDEAALDEYERRYDGHSFAPVVILIAAYDEQDSIGGVLDRIPDISCGMSVDTLVVVDGATDSTAEVAARHGAYTCHAPTNRGQGAALRLGYRLAAQRGAKYVVTTDADGQYDVAELPRLLEPLVDGTADFVSGSRTLGRSETTDVFRKVGTHVFAWIVSALTGQRITDTSFGFRGMRVEVPNSVRLEQPQYQSSELLVGVLARGFRVLEQPMTMLQRAAGQSKKGNNLLYGFRYARVVLGTWWRERRGVVPDREAGAAGLSAPAREDAARAVGQR